MQKYYENYFAKKKGIDESLTMKFLIDWGNEKSGMKISSLKEKALQDSLYFIKIEEAI